MQYLVTLTLDQLAATPAELHSAMTEFVESEIEAGNFVLTGGLARLPTVCGSSYFAWGGPGRAAFAGSRFRGCRVILA